jgi:2-oxoglutarate ferredoxin oxidoreductase subunit alpha
MINRQKIAESESYRLSDANEIIISHGIVSEAAKEAVDLLRAENYKIGLFRPVTLNPLDNYNLRKILRRVKKAYLFESSLNQLSRIIKYESYGIATPIIEFSKPAEGFTSDEIVKNITRVM